MARLIPWRHGSDEVPLSLAEGSYAIGRAADNDLVLTHRSLSLHHARLRLHSGGATLQDLGSTNGTFVEGKAIRESELEGGELIRLGSVEYRFELASDSVHPLLVQEPAEPSSRPLRERLEHPSSGAGKRGAEALGADERTRYKLQILLESTRLLGSPMPINRLLREILELSFQILDVDHGVVLMTDAKSRQLEPRVSKSRGSIDDPSDNFSRNVVQFVQKRGVAAIFADTRRDPRLKHAETLHHLTIRSCMCAPLKPKDEVLGVLYVSNVKATNRFGSADLEFLSAFANQAAVALESSLAFEEIRRMNDGLERQVEERTAELSRALQELERAQGQLVESEKQAMLGRLVAGIVHETNTPLGVLRSATGTLTRVVESTRAYVHERSLAGDEAARALTRSLDAASGLRVTVEGGVSRLQSLVATLKRFVSLDETELVRFDVREGLDAALTLLAPSVAPGVRVVREDAGDLAEVRCEPGRLNQSLSGVLRNALDAVGDAGTVAVRTRMLDDQVQIQIEDDGPGIPAERLARLFEFSFTRKEGRMQMALGLPTLKKVVDDLGGSVDVRSTPGQGTVVSVSLPAARGS